MTKSRRPSRKRVSPPKEEAPEPKETGFGMTVEALTPQITRRLAVPSGQGGAIVSDMDPRGVAALSGMAPTDIILAVNSTPVTSPDQVIKALEATSRAAMSRACTRVAHASGPARPADGHDAEEVNTVMR